MNADDPAVVDERQAQLKRAVDHRRKNFDLIETWQIANSEVSGHTPAQLDALCEIMKGAATEVFIAEIKLIFEN